MVSIAIGQINEFFAPHDSHSFSGTCHADFFHLSLKKPEYAKINREMMQLEWSYHIKKTTGKRSIASINYSKETNQCFLSMFLLIEDLVNFAVLADKRRNSEKLRLEVRLLKFHHDDREDITLEDFYRGLYFDCADFCFALLERD